MASFFSGSSTTIFGLKYSQHRKYLVGYILETFGISVGRRDTKSVFVRHLQMLEGDSLRLTAQDRTRLSAWFAYTHTYSTGILDYRTWVESHISPANHEAGSVDSGTDDIVIESEGDASFNSDGGFDMDVEESTRECSACYQVLETTAFPESHLTSSCKHDLNFCNPCTEATIDSQIRELNWNQIGCPECEERLSTAVVRQWASREAFRQYEAKYLMSSLDGIPDYVNCLNPNCSSGQIHDGGDDQPIVTCQACSFRFCFTHQMPWHTGQTCDDFDAQRKERLADEKASESVISRTAKTCPNPSCGARVVKIGGCDHMTCSRCRHEYCFSCLAPWGEIELRGNALHARHCPWHSARLPTLDNNGYNRYR